MSNLFDKTTDALATSLRMRQIRHNVTAANIANAETPNYHAKKMDFEDALASALDVDGKSKMSTTNGSHFANGATGTPTGDIYDNPDVAVNNDGNTVDLQQEMTSQAENVTLYKAALQLINKKMASIKYALGER